MIHVADIIAAMIKIKGAKGQLLDGFKSTSCLPGFNSRARGFMLSLSCSSHRRQTAVVSLLQRPLIDGHASLPTLFPEATSTCFSWLAHMEWESGEFPRGTHVIEATEVVGIGLPGLKDFHIMQGWTDRISEWKFFMCFSMITVHFGALFPPFAALTNLLVMPCAKVFVQESDILAPLIP